MRRVVGWCHRYARRCRRGCRDAILDRVQLTLYAKVGAAARSWLAPVQPAAFREGIGVMMPRAVAIAVWGVVTGVAMVSSGMPVWLGVADDAHSVRGLGAAGGAAAAGHRRVAAGGAGHGAGRDPAIRHLRRVEPVCVRGAAVQAASARRIRKRRPRVRHCSRCDSPTTTSEATTTVGLLLRRAHWSTAWCATCRRWSGCCCAAWHRPCAASSSLRTCRCWPCSCRSQRSCLRWSACCVAGAVARADGRLAVAVGASGGHRRRRGGGDSGRTGRHLVERYATDGRAMHDSVYMLAAIAGVSVVTVAHARQLLHAARQRRAAGGVERALKFAPACALGGDHRPRPAHPRRRA